MSQTLDLALSYAQEGHRVIPLWSVTENGTCCCPKGPDCQSPGKHPHGRLVPTGLKEASDDEERLRGWWRQAPDANVALLTGERFFVIDVDCHGGRDGRAVLDAIVAPHGALPRTARALTGGGGEHLFFALDPDVGARVRNQQGILVSGARHHGVDVRGAEGYVVAAPSVHASGRRYEWAVELHELAAPPPWLLALVAGGGGEVVDRPLPKLALPPKVDQKVDHGSPLFGPPSAAPAVVAAPAADPIVHPGVDVALVRSALDAIPPNEDRTSWIEMVSMPLHDAFHGSPEGFALWLEWCRRGEGMTTPNGHPAFGGESECRRIWKSFSTRRRNPKGIATLWAHARRHGWTPPDGAQIAGAPPAAAGGPPLFGASAEDETPWPVVPEQIWQPGPQPILDLARAFPGRTAWIAEYVGEIARLQQVDPAFPALLLMGMVAGACGRVYRAKIDEMAWGEPMALWIICAMGSGTGKSPILRPLVRPFHAFEASIDAAQRDEFAAWDAELDVARIAVAQAQFDAKKRARKGIESPIVREELSRAVAEARQRMSTVEAARPQSKKILASSLTTPALVEFLERHQERCLIVDPEGSVFQYALGGRTNLEKDIDPWLKSYGSEPIRQNRVGDRRDGPLERNVRAPTLSMALCTQTGALEMFNDQYASDRGFIARFLCATFDSHLPEVALLIGEVPNHLQERWDATVKMLLSKPVPVDPHVILLGGECRTAFDDHLTQWLDKAKLDPKADKQDNMGYQSPISAKIRSMLIRISALLHVLEDPETADERPMEITTMRAVIDVWFPYVFAMIRRSNIVLREDPALRIADRIANYIWREGCTEFSRTSVRRALSNSNISRADDLNPALSMLTDAGWIRPVTKVVFRGSHTIPAGNRYLVHPHFRDHFDPRI